MVKVIETVYPCENCGKDIAPTHKFCPSCGNEQTPVDERLHYNIFSRWQGASGAFNLSYGGHILDLEDAEILALQMTEERAQIQIFVGSYLLADMTWVSDHMIEIEVKNWYEVAPNGKLYRDQGPQTVTVTHLE